MITKCQLEIDIDARELGRVASKLESKEVQEFWFSFVDGFGNDRVLDEYARALSPSLGGKRKKIFQALFHAMEYHHHFEADRSTPDKDLPLVCDLTL